jgi:hypothetical protein
MYAWFSDPDGNPWTLPGAGSKVPMNRVFIVRDMSLTQRLVGDRKTRSSGCVRSAQQGLAGGAPWWRRVGLTGSLATREPEKMRPIRSRWSVASCAVRRPNTVSKAARSAWTTPSSCGWSRKATTISASNPSKSTTSALVGK